MPDTPDPDQPFSEEIPAALLYVNDELKKSFRSALIMFASITVSGPIIVLSVIQTSNYNSVLLTAVATVPLLIAIASSIALVRSARRSRARLLTIAELSAEHDPLFEEFNALAGGDKTTPQRGPDATH